MKRSLVETDSADSSDDIGVKELNPSKRGRKTLLGEQLDSKVRFFIKPVRDSGRVGNSITKMKQLGAKWLVKLYDHLCSNLAIIGRRTFAPNFQKCERTCYY